MAGLTNEDILDRLRQGLPYQWVAMLELAEGRLSTYGFKDLKSFITADVGQGGLAISVERAKELMYFNKAYHHKADELCQKMGLIELAKDTDVLGDASNSSNQHLVGSKTENSTKQDRGNKYRIAKLKRDNPEVAQRLMDGEFKSVSEAERAAGLSRPLLSNVEKVKRAYDRLSDDEKSEFDLLL